MSSAATSTAGPATAGQPAAVTSADPQNAGLQNAGLQNADPQNAGLQNADPQNAGSPGAAATLSVAHLAGDRTGQPGKPATSEGVTTTTTADSTAAAAPGATAPGATAQRQSGDSGQSAGGNGRPGTAPIPAPEDPAAAPAVAFGTVPQSQTVPPSQPVAGPAPAAPHQAPLPLPGPPATQLAMRIAPLLLDADGVHRLTVHLHPADLGPVQVIAEIRNGEINVQLSGATDAGNDALRNALDDLRRELERSGFSNTTLDLRHGPGQQDQARQQSGLMANGRNGLGPDGSALGPESADEASAPQPTGPDPDGRLDIRA